VNIAFIADTIDVRRFTNHQAAMVDARLHPADVVTHDEENIRLVLCSRRSKVAEIAGGYDAANDGSTKKFRFVVTHYKPSHLKL
jgi:hypothetical protein